MKVAGIVDLPSSPKLLLVEKLAAIDTALVVAPFAVVAFVAAALAADVNAVAIFAELPAFAVLTAAAAAVALCAPLPALAVPALAVPAAVALCAALAVLAAPATFAVTDRSSVFQLNRYP